MQSNADIELAILAKLPATYGQLVNALGSAVDRKIDAALQRLRRRGEIKFERKGRVTIWMVSGDGLESEIAQIIRDEVPGCIAAHERDGHDKLHPADIQQLAKVIADHVMKRSKAKKE